MDGSSTDNLIPHVLQYPANGPIGVIPTFTTHNQPITLKLPGARVLGGDYDVKDANNDQHVMKCKSKIVSLSGKKALEDFYDSYGKLLFHLERHALSYTFEATSPEDKKVMFTVKCSWHLKDVVLTLTFVNAADGKETTLSVHSGIFSVNRKAPIMLSGPKEPTVVGTISGSFITLVPFVEDDKRSYYLTVAPGVDFTMLVALCDCLDVAMMR